MSVDLSGSDGRMTEQGLNGADIGAIAQEVGGVAMAKGMRADILAYNAGFGGVFSDYSLDTSRSEP